jgi:hypothetical protein
MSLSATSVTPPLDYEFEFTNFTCAAPERESPLFITYHEFKMGTSVLQGLTDVMRSVSYPPCFLQEVELIDQSVPRIATIIPAVYP